MALSLDLRRRVLSCYQQGEGGYQKLAKRFSIGTNTVRRWIELWRKTGDVKKRDRGGGNPAKIPNEQLPMLRALVNEKPDRTLHELCLEWKERTQVQLALSTMFYALQRAALSFKKKPFGPLSKTTSG